MLFLLERGLCAAVFRKSAILSLLTAVVDELLQLIGDRAAQLIDVGLDFLGACLGMAIIWLIAVCVKKKRNQ
jgi:VanZ family protein